MGYLLGLLGLMLPKRLAGSETGAAPASESPVSAATREDRPITSEVEKCPGECKARQGKGRRAAGRLLATARATNGGVC